MAKNFSRNNPLEELIRNEISFEEPIENEFSRDELLEDEFSEEPIEDEYSLELNYKKSKVGRPKIKTEKTKTINIAVPVSMLDKLNIAKICYNNNLTQYINKLIEKDIEANFNDYECIANSLKRYK